MSGVLHSHRAQLVGTAVAAAATTAALISLYSALSKRSKRHELDKDVLRSLAQDKPPLPSHPPNEYPSLTSWNEAEHDDLVREQLARNYAFFGDEAMAKIRAGRVVVVGGIGHIRLIDFDYVTLSSLNRHATASLADVGTPKVRCVARALHGMARWVEVEECVEIWRAEGGEKLLEGADWVVDAIDNIQTKVELLYHCHSQGIKVFSSMGAGAKSDPTRIQIADLADTIYDPLARAVRTRLRRALSFSSSSSPSPPLPPLPPPSPSKSASPSSTPPKSPPSPSSPFPTPHSPTPTSSASSPTGASASSPSSGPSPRSSGCTSRRTSCASLLGSRLKGRWR
ncbi:hypothetical protein B0H12DRAFT_1331698 [Mycena haematopus]|nr:hypothetical protein B0H12DRAFT_1331698 [Mycena haematopus]